MKDNQVRISRKTHERSKSNVITWILFTILVIYCIVLVLPLLWGLVTSFKDRFEYSKNPLWFPKEFTFDNYVTAWMDFYIVTPKLSKIYMETMLLNTVLYAFGCAFFSTFTPFLVAYLTTQYRFKFSKIIDKIVLVVMIVPVVGSLPSEIMMAKTLGLYDQIWGIWIMSMSFLGMYFLIFSATFRSIPKEFTEAASVDGASNTRIMFTVVMPLAMNTFFAVFLLKFISYWNEYQSAIVYLPSYPTLASGLLSFSDTNLGVPTKLAGTMILCIPIFVLFLIFKNKVMGNLTLGGVKS